LCCASLGDKLLVEGFCGPSLALIRGITDHRPPKCADVTSVWSAQSMPSDQGQGDPALPRLGPRDPRATKASTSAANSHLNFLNLCLTAAARPPLLQKCVSLPLASGPSCTPLSNVPALISPTILPRTYLPSATAPSVQNSIQRAQYLTLRPDTTRTKTQQPIAACSHAPTPAEAVT
jgi:hypothetical protein